MFNVARIDEYREGNRFEVKLAQGGLPDSVWATYSAFANANGGVSDPRNSTLFTIFSLVGIGERAGKGDRNAKHHR